MGSGREPQRPEPPERGSFTHGRTRILWATSTTHRSMIASWPRSLQVAASPRSASCSPGTSVRCSRSSTEW